MASIYKKDILLMVLLIFTLFTVGSVNAQLYTPDNYSITLDKDYYYINETVLITVYAPDNTTLDLNISGPNESFAFSTTVFSSTAMVFIPKYDEEYIITADMDTEGYRIIKDKTFDVKRRLFCEIIAPSKIVQNVSSKFEAKISGGTSPFYYDWQFPEDNYDIASPKNRFLDLGQNSVMLKVKDKRNEEAYCEVVVDVIEKEFDIEVVVKDDYNDIKIGDCVVEMGGQEKKTNVNGVARFSSITEGRYKVVVKRKGYETFSERFDIIDDKKLLINLTSAKEDDSLYPHVIAYGIKNGQVFDNKDMNVKFSVSSESDIESCMLLVNRQGYLGYSVEDSLKNISNGDHTLTAHLSNGQFKVKVNCKNTEGMGSSNLFEVKGIGFPETEEVILKSPISKVSAKKTSEKDDTNEGGNDNDKNEENIKTAEYLQTFDELLGKFKDSLDVLQSISPDRHKIADLLEIEQSLAPAISEIPKLRQKRLDLDKIKISQSSLDSEIVKIEKELKELKDQTPIGFEVKDRESFIELVSEQETQSMIEEYVLNRDIDISERDIGKLLKKSRELQEEVIVYVDMYEVDVQYADGRTLTKSIIKKEYDIEGNLTSGFFLESIPKEFADDAIDIKSDQQFEVIKYDPIIKFVLDDDNEVLYYVNGKKDFSVMTNAKSVFILDPNHPGNLITGFSITGDIPLIGGNFTLLLSLMVLIAVGTGLTTMVSKEETRNNIMSVLKVSKGSKNSKKKIDVKAKVSQQSVSPTNIVQQKNIAVPKKDSNVTECIKLLETAIALVKSDDDSAATQIYPKILASYNMLGEKSKGELKPIILYMSSLVEVQYLGNLLDKANQQVIDGSFVRDSDMFREIEDCYANIPDRFVHKLSQKYERYQQMLNMRNLRQRSKMNQMLDREEGKTEDEIHVDDMLYRNDGGQ